MAKRPSRSNPKPAPDAGTAMAVALARQLLRTGAFTADDVRAMVVEMDEIAAAALDERPEAAKATQKGATYFRRALGNEPGVEFPFVLTAG